jgi:hypothetical protein
MCFFKEDLYPTPAARPDFVSRFLKPVLSGICRRCRRYGRSSRNRRSIRSTPFHNLQNFLFRIKSVYLRLTFRKAVNLFYSNDVIIPIMAIVHPVLRAGTAAIFFSERTARSKIIYWILQSHLIPSNSNDRADKNLPVYAGRKKSPKKCLK